MSGGYRYTGFAAFISLEFRLMFEMGRWEDGKMGRWEDGKMGRWEDGKMGRWEVGKMGSWEVGKLGSWEVGKLGWLPLLPPVNSGTFEYNRTGTHSHNWLEMDPA